MTVALYCRVSTDEQAQHGFSLEAQKDRLVAYCQSQGWEDYQVYTDDGYSGTSLDRPALQKLLRHIDRGIIDSVLVYRLDRLSRRQRHVLYLLEEIFEKHNISFRSATEPFDTSTPLGKAMIGILAVFAQLERETIIERTREGHYKRAKQGLWGGGPVPFGYRWDKESGRLEIDPWEAHIVSGIYRRFLDGHSLLACSDWAAQHDRQNRWWDHNVIKAILQRDTYLGMITYGNEHSKGNHESIIDPDTAEAARTELRRRLGRHRPRTKYLLTGLLRCGECGEPMTHVQSKGKRGKTVFHYYVCSRKQQGKRYYKGGEPCPSRHISQAEVEQQVIESVKGIATDPSDLKSHSTNINDSTNVSVLESELQKVQKRLSRWYDAYEDGAIDTRELRERIRKLEDQKTRLELAIEDAHEEAESATDITLVLDAFQAIRDAWDAMEFDEQRSVLSTTIREVRVYQDGHVDVQWNF